jgi:hypothetical protein
MSAMRNDRVFITPRSHGRMEEPPLLMSSNGTDMPVSGTWGAWADRRECPLKTFAWDPWACHFISLSNCNTPEVHDLNYTDDFPPDPDERVGYTKLVVSTATNTSSEFMMHNLFVCSLLIFSESDTRTK